ncbi:DUF2778 domain-containing protein [Aureimonas pseudogalii]|uniref:Tlde1 domain-containing protein n=1 Tax=Aureimonas pseudogalii TaxID=1744844 RepID=A0A7W6EAD6_9HYPH|nr:DUF2778 domain-containing protein [Aureimonas pseudogalii]MBB3997626.1 hypothetical protein [Aureimonas pseudogalii]
MLDAAPPPRADAHLVLAMTTLSMRHAATAAIATHRLDRPDAAIAARFASISGTPVADFVVADARDRPSPVQADISAASAAEGTDATRASVAGEVEMALLSVPLPTRRPVMAPLAPAAPQPVAPRRTAEAPPAEPRAVPLLAYARPDAGSLSMPDIELAPTPGTQNPRLERGTAIYDISAAAVYLPNGERLEAHSGLGAMRDDVRFVREKMRGPTPPHIYDLTLRESLFHGVQALRLNPVGGQRNVHNRVGLLAHTYMLGPRGDSNGCVSIKDYKRFLAAYRRGEIRRLKVVDKLDAASTPKSSLLARFFRT